MIAPLRKVSRSSFLLGINAIIAITPLAIAVIPWGILTGAIAIQIGLTPFEAQLMSLLVFAGAAQLSAMTLMSNSASPLSLFTSTFVISSRHLLYSIVFREHMMRLPFYRRLFMAFVLTDEMFAVSQAHTQSTGHFSALFAFISGITFYLVWNIATFAGIYAGEFLNDLDGLGLDFAIAATFIAMTFSELRRFPVFIAMIVSGGVAIFIKPYLTDSYIVIAAIIGMIAAYVSDNQRGSKVDKSVNKQEASS